MRKSFFFRRQREQRELASRQVRELFSQASRERSEELRTRCVSRAHRLALKHKIRLPPELKRQYCKRCFAFWFLGRTARVRVSQGKAVYTCLACGAIRRFSTKA
jgi:ribonuclease P protein subunit RPR2